MKQFINLIISVLLIAALTVPGFAADQSEEGQAEIQLTAGTITLIDPTDGTATADLPSEFQGLSGISIDFGANNLTGTEEIIDAATNVRLGIIVSDLRGQGGGSTWSVTAQLGRFEQGGVHTLVGAELILTPYGSVIPDPASANAPTALPQNLRSNNSTASLVFESKALNTGSAGVWATEWTPQLKIPANAESGSHQADLTWTLSDGV